MKIKREFDYFLLDWDGCLADTLSLWLSAYKKVFAQYNLTVSDADIVSKAFGNWQAAGLFGLSDNEEFGRKLTEFISENIKTVGLNGDAFAGLTRMKESNKKIAIVTSSLKELVMPALEFNEIDSLIDTVVDGEEVQNHKPDPEPVLLAMSRVGAIKDKTIMIGDSSKDVLAGKNAGVATAIYYPETNKMFYSLEEIASWNPDFIFESFEELV